MKNPIILAGLGYFIFAMIDLLAKILTVTMNTYQIAGQSALYVSIISIVYYIFIKKIDLKFSLDKVMWYLSYITSNAINIVGLFWLLSKTTQSQIYPILLMMPFVIPFLAFIHKRVSIPFIDYPFLLFSFCGVVLIVGFSPNLDILTLTVTLIVMLLASMRAYSNNQLQGEVSSVYLIVGSQFLLFILTFLFFKNDQALFVNFESSLIILVISVFATMAMGIMIYVYTVGIPHLIAAMQYTQLIWGVFFGYLFFQETLSTLQLLGIFMVISSGVIFAAFGKNIRAMRIRKMAFRM